MLNLSGERTLVSAIVPPLTTHTNGLLGFFFKDQYMLVLAAALFSSIPYDFFIKVMGKSNLYEDNAGKLPIVDSKFNHALSIRALLLNCLTKNYSALWAGQFRDSYKRILVKGGSSPPPGTVHIPYTRMDLGHPFTYRL